VSGALCRSYLDGHNITVFFAGCTIGWPVMGRQLVVSAGWAVVSGSLTGVALWLAI